MQEGRKFSSLERLNVFQGCVCPKLLEELYATVWGLWENAADKARNADDGNTGLPELEKLSHYLVLPRVAVCKLEILIL